MTVPTLNVAGWWDQEDFYGPVTIYRALEPHDTKHLNYLVVGPWNHGGWRGRTGDKLGPIDFGSNTAQYYRKNIELPWFAYWLKDKGKLELAEATTFESGCERVAVVRQLAAEARSHRAQAVLPPGRQALVRRAARDEARQCVRRVRVRSVEAGSVPREADPLDVRAGLDVVATGSSTTSASPRAVRTSMRGRPLRSTKTW